MDGQAGRAGQAAESGGIDVAGDGVRRLFEEVFERIMLAGRDQTQMAVGQGEGGQARQGAQNRDAERRQRPCGAGLRGGGCRPGSGSRRRHRTSVRKLAKPWTSAAADWACDFTSSTSTTGQPVRAARSAVEPVPSAAPSNRPMTPSTISRSALSSASPARVSGAHRPGVQVEAGPAAGRRVEHRVDVVRADLAGRHRHAGIAQMPQQRQHRDGLAAARRRGGEDQAGARAWLSAAAAGAAAGQRAEPVERRAQQHHVADHHQGGRLDPVGRHIVGAALQRGFQHVLVGQTWRW